MSLDKLNETLLLMSSMLVSNLILYELERQFGAFTPIGRVAYMLPWALTYPWLREKVWSLVE